MKAPTVLTLLLAALLWAAGAAQAGVQVTGAWARATLPGQKVAGVYLRLESDAGARLVGVRSTAAKTAEVHETTHTSGVMKMRRIESLALPAGEPVSLQPGGLHIMLLDIHQPLHAGQRVQLTLIVEQGGKHVEVPVQAEVKALLDAVEPTRH